jgi:beta-lactamase superfamily II metal-dependent hydrolase
LNFDPLPEDDEIEVSVFGRGVGESVLVHCGFGHWVCVDCAIHDGNSWPVLYLNSFSQHLINNIRLIIATHWHADHVSGISNLVKTCRNARFCCSAALRTDEFKCLVARFSADNIAFPKRPPLSEIRATFEFLASRKDENDPSYRPPDLVVAHQVLDRFNVGASPVTITALSPSPQDRLDAQRAFAEYFVPIDIPATGLSPIDQNHASVVVHIQIGNEHILLGGDLERTNSEHTGWNAIVASTIRPQEKSSVFKVPHHGSSTAHSTSVWEEMITKDAIAVLTPNLSSALPRDEELQWLKQQGRTVLATGLPKKATIKRRREVDSKMKAATKKIVSYTLPEGAGLVRLRKSPRDVSWKSELFGSAVKVC